jgi:hypothetical protein
MAVVPPVTDGKETSTNGTAQSDRRELRQSNVSGADYIKKIFQVPFTLAPVAAGQLEEFLGAMYRDAELPAPQKTEIRDSVVPHLDFLVRGSSVNPREIKRYVNAYTLQRKIKGDLDPDVMLALQTIDFQPDWEPVRLAFYPYRELFTKALHRQLVENQPGALDDLDPELTPMPDSFIEYVSAGSPAHGLLACESLNQYIYSGAATRSTHNIKLLDGIRALGELSRTLRVLEQQGSIDDRGRQEVKSKVSMLRTTLGPTIHGPLAPLIHRDLESLALALDAPPPAPPPAPGETPVWYSEATRLVRQLRPRLLDLYRTGQADPTA